MNSNKFEDNKFIFVDAKKCRRGYTTGSCAAAAAKAAAIMLFSRKKIKKVDLMTPKGFLLSLDVLDAEIGENYASCAIKKDGGDDPDVTNGILIYANVSFDEKNEIFVTGGKGVGMVTKPGLQCEVGSFAINKVPMMMIKKEIKEICDDFNYRNGMNVKISVPEGEEIAKRTFNPRLGIVGGISILGTSGIVEPMSEKALLDTIKVEMKQYKAEGFDYLLITPGNYGASFSKDNFTMDMNKCVKCSNFIGDTIDMAIELGVKGILFVAHIGKFVKVAGGIMNTHSKNADSRMEILAANAILAGADINSLREVMKAVTTDDALKVLNDANLMDKTMKNVSKKIDFYLENRAKERLEIGAVVFSNVFGILGKTQDADELINKITKEGK